ncbi:MAG: Mpo1-like protein [Terriglobales bacterium]
MAGTFDTYDDFFAFYVKQHRNRGNRILHALGTALGLLVLVAALAAGRPWLALLWAPIAYGFAWTGHFLLERNKPATFGHPFWSFISDFRMLGLMLVGRLGPWLESRPWSEASAPGTVDTAR